MSQKWRGQRFTRWFSNPITNSTRHCLESRRHNKTLFLWDRALPGVCSLSGGQEIESFFDQEVEIIVKWSGDRNLTFVTRSLETQEIESIFQEIERLKDLLKYYSDFWSPKKWHFLSPEVRSLDRSPAVSFIPNVTKHPFLYYQLYLVI